MVKTIQERLRGPIKHPQECVNQRQEAANHIDALEERCEAYKGQVEAGSKRIFELEAKFANIADAFVTSTNDYTQISAAIYRWTNEGAGFRFNLNAIKQQRDNLAAAVRSLLEYDSLEANKYCRFCGTSSMNHGILCPVYKAEEALAKLDADTSDNRASEQ